MKKILFLLCYLNLAWANFSADEILKRADEIRNPSESFFMQVEVVSNSDTSLFDVYLQGKDKTLIKTVLPKRDLGRNMLMLEDSMWIYIPNLKREVRVSLNQKLSGQTANGDIARLRWVGDYTPTIESEDRESWMLNLNANRKGLTYDKLKLVIAKKNFWPKSGTYLTVSGKPLKLVQFTEYKEMAGATRPSKLIIEDALKTGDLSTLTIKTMRVESFKESLFNKNSLQ